MVKAKSLFPRSTYVGFDTMLEELDRITSAATDHYPPTNIIKTSEKEYLVELAVAGFSEEELDIEVVERTLTVRGSHEDRGREYIHKGISTKKFERKFRLSEYVEVSGANLKDGVLAIELEVIVPDEKSPRKIQISSKTASPELLCE